MEAAHPPACTLAANRQGYRQSARAQQGLPPIMAACSCALTLLPLLPLLPLRCLERSRAPQVKNSRRSSGSLPTGPVHAASLRPSPSLQILLCVRACVRVSE